MKIFVTGGSGFVGRNLIEMSVQRGVQVRALSRSESAAATVRALGAEPVPGDLDDESALCNGMADCDLVFHSAAHVLDWGDAATFHRINVTGTERVLAAARSAGVPRLVHVSTEAVLVGGPPLHGADETWPRPAHPVGLYPLTKGLAEERVQAANSAALTTVIARPRFIWGRGDNTLLPQLVQAVRGGGYAWIDGGHYQSSTCHVRNVCEGLWCAAARGRGGEIYFLTDGASVEFRQFITAMLKTQGITPPDRSVPRWLARALAASSELLWRTLPLSGRPPISRSAVRLIGEEVTVRDDKARREIGYVGHVTREAGLSEMQEEAARQP
jgi:nucleoside-diphosphate-sugar epimerase